MVGDRELEQQQFRELRTGGHTDLRDRLIEEHLWLARHCARRFSGRGEPPEDLEQVASMALVKAVDRFDPDRNVRFTTFAVPTILGELRRHFRDKTWSVRVSRRLKDLNINVRTVNEQMTQDLGRTPSIDELADGLGVSPEEVLEALEAGAAYRSASLDVGPAGDDDQIVIPGEDHEALEETPMRVALHQAMSTLGDRERRAVYLRFYLGLTQAEIAEQIGVSQVHVSRILRSTLAHLGDELSDLREVDDDYSPPA